MTDDLLRIAEEMEACNPLLKGGQSPEMIFRSDVFRWAARIRACVSPEAVAFFEAAMRYGKTFTTLAKGENIRWVDPTALSSATAAFDDAYRALLAAQEKGEGAWLAALRPIAEGGKE